MSAGASPEALRAARNRLRFEDYDDDTESVAHLLDAFALERTSSAVDFAERHREAAEHAREETRASIVRWLYRHCNLHRHDMITCIERHEDERGTP